MGQKLNLNEIIAELAKGNESSLEALFDYYYPRLYSFSKSFFKVEHGIDDILQEVFVKIWQNRKNIKTPSTFNSFVFTIARNLLLNEIRRNLNQQNLKDEVREIAVAKEFSLIKQVEYEDLKEKVDNIIEELPPRQKEIFILSRSEGLSHKEIAKKLGITPKTVEYHITLVLRKLRRRLKELGFLSVLYCYLFL